jgi:hypothetical protein
LLISTATDHLRAPGLRRPFPIHGTAMEESHVKDILLPYQTGLAVTPSVTLNHRIADALALMAENGLTQITVVWNGRAIGRIRIEDAFERLGLCLPGVPHPPGR